MIRLFIGSSSMGEDEKIERAYSYTLNKNCSEPLNITWMRQTNDKTSVWAGWQANMWSTPFSGFRWAIPELCEFKGRAIYTDCDMINYRDMAELINIDMEGKAIAARRGTRFGGHEFCVMVFDCEHPDLDLIPIDRQRMIDGYHLRMINRWSGSNNVCDLDPRWNCLDGENRPLDDIYQLHFTNMATQPWRPGWYTGHPEFHPRDDIAKEFYNWSEEAEEHHPWNVEYETDVTYGCIGR